MKKYLISKFLFLSIFSVYGQVPNSLWQQTIGGSSIDVQSRVEDPTSNEYFLIGVSHSDISGDKTENSRGGADIWIVKMSASHTVLWDKTIGGDNMDFVSDILVQNNKLYILCQSNSSLSGEKSMAPYSTGGEYDLWLLCCDLTGNILWQEQYGGSLEETGGQIIELVNGNILIGCQSNSGISAKKSENALGGTDLWFVEINPLNGIIIQQKTRGSANDDLLYQLSLSNNGTILALATSETGVSFDKSDPGYGGTDLWLVELNDSLEVLSDKCFGGSTTDGHGGGDIMFIDGFYYVAANSSSPISGNKTAPYQGSFDGFEHSDFWILKLDLNFNLIWDRTFGGVVDDECFQILYNDWNKLVISGVSNSGISGNKTSPKYGDFDGWFIILDYDGNQVVQFTFGGSGYDFGRIYSDSTNPQNLYFAGGSSSTISGNKTVGTNGGQDTWIMEIDASAFLSLNSASLDNAPIIFPNPSEGAFTIKNANSGKNSSIEIQELTGKVVYTSPLLQETQHVSSNLPSGTYQVILKKGNDSSFVAKLIVL